MVTLTFGASGQLTEQIRNGAPFDVLLARLQELADTSEHVFVFAHQLKCGGPGGRLDAPHSRRDTRFSDHAKESDFGCVLHVRAAAELHGKARNGYDTHHVPILFAEECHRACFDSFLSGTLFSSHRNVATNLFIHKIFDLILLFACYRLNVREIEPESIWGDQRT